MAQTKGAIYSPCHALKFWAFGLSYQLLWMDRQDVHLHLQRSLHPVQICYADFELVNIQYLSSLSSAYPHSVNGKELIPLYRGHVILINGCYDKKMVEQYLSPIRSTISICNDDWIQHPLILGTLLYTIYMPSQKLLN